MSSEERAQFELEDNTMATKEFACVSGACETVDILRCAPLAKIDSVSPMACVAATRLCAIIVFCSFWV